jgi:hypothetical protein
MADLPRVAERVADPAEAPAVLLVQRRELGGAEGDGARDQRAGVVDDQRQADGAPRERLGAEVPLVRRLVGDPEAAVADAQQRDDGLVLVGPADAVQLGRAEASR